MEVFQMCEPGQAPAMPATTGEALAVLEGALDYLTRADAAHLPAAEQAACLSALERAASRHTAARASILAAFTAQGGFAGDGQHSARAWLIWQTSVTAGAAAGAVGWMKRLAAHPAVGRALAAGDVSASWAREICGWTARLPADKRDDADRILLAAAAGGADLAALAGLAEEMHRRSCPPDAEDDGFDDRRLRLDRTFRGAGRLDADLTPACSVALAAVLDALGQKAGPEDERSKRQRDHDALEEACTRLIASGMLPERAGQPTHIQLHMTLRELRGAGDSSAAEAAWSAAGAAGYGWLTGPAAEAAACDAAIVPVVSGHVDYAALAEMTEMFLNAHGLGADCVMCGSRGRGELSAEGQGDGISTEGWADWVSPDGISADSVSAEGPVGRLSAHADRLCTHERCSCGHCAGAVRGPLNPATLARLSSALLARAADVLSGPVGLAAFLRGHYAPSGRPYMNVSLPLDIGTATEEIPAHLRRAVILRDRCCAFPGCGQPPAACQVHHIQSRSKGGATSLRNMVLLCRFHHLIAVHRWGWQIALHPDGTVTATSPDGQRTLHSHGPPPALAA